MRFTVAVATVLFGAAAAPAWAQIQQSLPPAVSRQLALPDTLGASFDIADSARAAASPNDWNFLVGLFEFRFQSRRRGAEWNPVFTGHWLTTRKHSANAFVEDHWRADNANATLDDGTWTYRIYNPRRKLWEMQGVDSESGAWQPGLCWSDANNRYVIQHSGNVIMRIRYFDITDTSFAWRADASRDGGKTWVLDVWTMTARRVAR